MKHTANGSPIEDGDDASREDVSVDRPDGHAKDFMSDASHPDAMINGDHDSAIDGEMQDYLAQFKADLENGGGDQGPSRPRRARHKSRDRVVGKASKSNGGRAKHDLPASSDTNGIIGGMDVAAESGSPSTGRVVSRAGLRWTSPTRDSICRIASVSGIVLLASSLVVAGLAQGGGAGVVSAKAAGTASQVVGSASTTFAIPREAVFAEAASRSNDREVLTVDGDWGGLEDLEVPVTMSAKDRKALEELRKTVESASKLHKESAGRVESDSNRSALKKSIDEAGKLVKSSMVVESDSKAKTKALNDLMDKVKADVASKRAKDEKAADDARRRAAGTGGSSSPLSDPAGQTSGSASGLTAPNGTSARPVEPSGDGTGDAVADYAMQFVGYPYVWGAEGPTAFDCSGLVKYVYSKFGISLPHYSGAQMSAGYPVGSLAEARPGDIVASGSHAAIYIGGGKIVNALNPAEGVKVTGLEVFGGGYVIRRIFK